MVRPIVEYCCVVWNPTKVSEIVFIEGIQRTATSKIAGISDMNYWERLKKLELMSLPKTQRTLCIGVHA